MALFATEYGTTRADGNGMCDLAESQRWWDWLDANNVGCANWSVADMTETSAAFQPGTSATGPWTDPMLKRSGLIVRNYIMSKHSPVASQR